MDTARELSSQGSADSDSLLAGVRRLTALADQASEPETVYRALAGELSVVLGVQEVHVHHLGAEPAQAEDLVAVYLFGGAGRLSYLAARGERPPGVSWVASTGRSFLAHGPRELAASVPRLAGSAGAHEGPVDSALLLPLRVRGEIESIVIAVSRLAPSPARPSSTVVPIETVRQPRLSASDLEHTATLVDQAATALALVHARAEAGTDAVTGCMNHRAMRRRLQEEIARAGRTGAKLACMIMDLDDFKLVNDRYGHPAGDNVLRDVAQALMGEFRAFDRVARYGGDEFVAILPEADLASAAAAAGRALQRVQEIPAPGSTGPISASIGVAQWFAPMSVDDLLARCDEALLGGKRDGKGRVSVTLRDSKGGTEERS
jgi:diguanylate cyclase (GGDEF)-like protein